MDEAGEIRKILEIIIDIYRNEITNQDELFSRIDKLANDYTHVIIDMKQKDMQDLLDACKDKNLAGYEEEKLKQHIISIHEKFKKEKEEIQKEEKEQMMKNVEILCSSCDIEKQIEAKRAIENELNEFGSSININVAKPKLYQVKDYVNDMENFDTDKGFCPKLFDKLSFPNGTLSYIGARTGRGKTSALANLAREALFLDKPYKVLFVTLEMSCKDILNKLILSKVYNDKAHDDNFKKSITSTNPSVSLNPLDYKEQKDEICKFINKENLILADARGVSERKIINLINNTCDQNTVVLIDYVQRIPAKEKEGSDTYRKVQVISSDLQNATAKTNAVIISAAQFSRASSEDGDDKFNEASFRESGDIEQDAHNAIGIGWMANKQDRFYEIMKTRSDARQGDKFKIEFIGQCSYMECKEKIISEEVSTHTKKRVNNKQRQEELSSSDKSL
jgi:hypothetical protein